jgi:predicted Ser/Thr protein kinase
MPIPLPVAFGPVGCNAYGVGETRIGTEIAGFKIESVLGRGGMSVVYLAEQTRLARKVALKLLAPEIAGRDPSFRERFLQESHLAAALDHPNIIPIYDAGEENDFLYIAMRYVEGRDLGQILEHEGGLGLGRTMFILEQVSGALDAAHEHGLVHRDVKPANILLVGESDRVYLTDFGVAKPTTSAGLTRTGFFIGTPDYSAPEQIEGREVDARTDVYALGAVLYSCLTGVAPYSRDTEVAVLQAHLLEPPPKIAERRRGLPRGLDRVVETAMAKSKDDRYATCSDMIGAARAASLERATPHPAYGPGLTVPVAGVGATEVSRDAPVADGAASETTGVTEAEAPAPAGTQASVEEGAPATVTGATAEAPPSAPPTAPAPAPPTGGDGTGGRSRRKILIPLAAAVAAAAIAGVAVYFVTKDDGSSPVTRTETTPTSPTKVAGLAAIVPPTLFKDCTVQPTPTAGAAETAVCLPPANRTLPFYPDQWEVSTYASDAALNKAYNSLRMGNDIGQNYGACNGIAWGGEGPWLHNPVGGVAKPGGRRLCYFDGNVAVIVWTHEKLGQASHIDMLGVAREGGSDHPALFNWWRFWHHRVGKCPLEGCTAKLT